MVATLDRFGFRSKPKRFDLDMKDQDSSPVRLSVEEAPTLEIKYLPTHLRYILLGRYRTLSVIIAANLTGTQIEALVSMLNRYKGTIE